MLYARDHHLSPTYFTVKGCVNRRSDNGILLQHISLYCSTIQMLFVYVHKKTWIRFLPIPRFEALALPLRLELATRNPRRIWLINPIGPNTTTMSCLTCIKVHSYSRRASVVAEFWILIEICEISNRQNQRWKTLTFFYLRRKDKSRFLLAQNTIRKNVGHLHQHISNTIKKTDKR